MERLVAIIVNMLDSALTWERSNGKRPAAEARSLTNVLPACRLFSKRCSSRRRNDDHDGDEAEQQEANDI